MSELVIENIRLKELILVVNKNKPFFDEFLLFLNEYGYENIRDFILEKNEDKLDLVLKKYFEYEFSNFIYDGIARPYDKNKSKWFFITWLLRDAPQQRLQPIVASIKIKDLTSRRIFVIKKLIKFIAPLMPEKDSWEWNAISEVMLQRLEGSRRALKGGLFEAIVRAHLTELFKSENLKIQVTDREISLNDETYDIELIGKSGKILLPVKTRETMGGGHALLFTRDIHKSISVAKANGFECIPVVIAKSWSGKLDGLNCDNYIYIPINPNQVEKISPILTSELKNLTHIFSKIQ